MSTNTLVLGLFEYDPTTDANLPFSITDALNNNWDKIDSLVPLLSTIAAPFNPEQSYAVGAYCTYQGNLQRCNTNIPTGEVWNPSHWDAVTIMSQSVNSGQINQPNGVAGLNEQSQLDSSVIPPLDYDPAGSANTVQQNLTSHINDTDNPHQVTTQQIGALLAIAAAATYNPSGTYAVGDYCTNFSNLYKCNTPIESGEPWTAEHWTETSVAAELAEVRASLSNKADRGGVLPESWMTIPNGKKLWFYTGGQNGYYLMNSGTDMGIYDHDNHALLSLNYQRSPKIANDVSLATATPPQKQNISLLNGVQPTDSGCVFWKQQDNVCTVAIACTKPTDGLTPDMIIGTLPVGFRPSYIERAGYAATTAGQSFSGTVRIWSDGNVQIWFPNTSANIFIAEASFPVLDNGGAE